MSVYDKSGNIVATGKKRILFETGNLTTTGALANDKERTYKRSKMLLKCNPETEYEIELNSTDKISGFSVFCFGEDGSLIQTITPTLSNGVVSVTTPSECKLVKLSALTTGYPDFIPVAYADGLCEVCNLNLLNTNIGSSLAFNYKVTNGVFSSGRLILPPNYTIDGTAVPLIVFVHGSGGMTTWNSVIGYAGSSADYRTYLNYLANEGYAVFDCYPWTDKETLSETYSPICLPVNINSYIKGIEYVCSRFNVDINNVVLYCKSQGGNIGHWATVESAFPFKGVGLFAPTTDPYQQKSGNLFYNANCREAITKYTSLDGTEQEISTFISNGNVSNETVMSLLNKNKGKFTSMFPFAQGVHGCTSSDDLFNGGITVIQTVPQWMTDLGLPARQSSYDYIPAIASHSEYTKHAQRPVKFWCAFDDTQTSSYGNYAIHQWLLNGGSDSEFRVLPIGTGGHHAMDTDANALKSSGTTALGIAYTNIPTAYVELVAFFNYCLSK